LIINFERGVREERRVRGWERKSVMGLKGMERALRERE
jgi:hypothetical protein